MTIDYLSIKNSGTIRELIGSFKFSEYRKYHIFKKEDINEYLFRQIQELIKNKNGKVAIAKEGKKVVGLISLLNLNWDSEIFGFRMAKIAHLIVDEYCQNSFPIKYDLIFFILNECKFKKIDHLSCRVDTEDFSACHALEANNFRIMDTLVTYIFDKLRYRLPYFKELFRVRLFRKEDTPTLSKLSKERFLNSRFYKDSNFPKDKIDLMHGEWIRNSCSNLTDARVFVAEKNNMPVGFIMYKKNKEVENFFKIKIYGSGLLVSNVKGAGHSLIGAMLKDLISLKIDILEIDTQITNYEILRLLQGFGLNFVSSKYTFHLSL